MPNCIISSNRVAVGKKYDRALEQFRGFFSERPDSGRRPNAQQAKRLDGLQDKRSHQEFQASPRKLLRLNYNACWLGLPDWKLVQYDEPSRHLRGPGKLFELILNHAQAMALSRDSEMRRRLDKDARMLKKAPECRLNAGIRIAHADLGAIYAAEKTLSDRLRFPSRREIRTPDQPRTPTPPRPLVPGHGQTPSAAQPATIPKVRELHKKTKTTSLKKCRLTLPRLQTSNSPRYSFDGRSLRRILSLQRSPDFRLPMQHQQCRASRPISYSPFGSLPSCPLLPAIGQDRAND